VLFKSGGQGGGGGGGIVRLLRVPVPAPGSTEPLTTGTRCSVSRGKAAGIESDRALPSSSKNKNVSGYTSTRPRVLLGCTGTALLS